ncbi:hypothetical protein H6P81_017950 [Aristolochia fimbriata]|uniref:tRNA pseudouridine(55) synthase n=1 Tax=Aristolochia fimbriata TaxID=158543 RepID=A0AAV7E2R9_ARIFI|nr:hypothetical protein H6P81_017950 [Aristolochia fimbriata]
MSTELDELELIKEVVSSVPRHALEDLLDIGVCARCILRLFGVQGRVYASSKLSTSLIKSIVDDPKACNKTENGCHSVHHASESDSMICIVCLGILQFVHKQEGEAHILREREAPKIEFVASLTELLKKEGHQADSLSLEVSVPAIILENELEISSYVNKKFGPEDWFQEKFLTKCLSVKDCLKLSIKDALETLQCVESGLSSFRIRLCYSHSKESSKLQKVSEKQISKRMKTDTGSTVLFKHDTNQVIHENLDSTAYEAPKDSLALSEKVPQPCNLAYHCYHTPIYIGGRYLKFSRNVSQTRWIIDDERMGEASVEEIIGGSILHICRSDTYKFHAAGREDIDVRMLGSGRPFLVEVVNPRHIPSSSDIVKLEDTINNLEGRFVGVRKLRLVGNEVWDLMREGEAEKQKQYAALVWISRPVKDEDLESISAIRDMDILQKTPIRVLHRRSPLERTRIIHWMKIERISGSCQYFLLHLCTQAGTYIKEFVHGDLGRTHPSIGSILGSRAEILQLDVTDVKMDCFN